MEKYVEQLRHCRANSHMEKAITVRNTESDQTSEVANFILLNNHQAFKQPLLVIKSAFIKRYGFNDR